MSLKKNFYQALGELLGNESQTGSGSEQEPARADVDPASEMPPEASAQEQVDQAGNLNTHGDSAAAPGKGAGPAWKKPFIRESASYRQAETSSSPQASLPQAHELTVISRNTAIVGDIRSLADVTIQGNVRGRVEVLKDVNVQGMLVGDLACKSAKLMGSSVQGNVLSKENIMVDRNSTILGNLTAQNAIIDGRVKGNIEAGGKVEFLENAIIAGDIHTSSISIADGANIQGFISTAFLNENSDSAFPSQIVIDEDSIPSGE